MSNKQIVRLILVVLLALTLPAGIRAQNENLLTNPGFEADFTNFEGEQPRDIAEGWIPWNAENTGNVPSFQNAQPRYLAVANADDIPQRIHNGQNAQVYFSFFETHDAGIYQQVSGITPGAKLRFSIFSYVWSSTFNDTEISEDPGDVAIQLGIDPNGGTNPFSDDVVYSSPAVFYDMFHEYSVETTANNDTVTVFVRSTVGLPVQNTYVFLDEASLEVAPATDLEESDDGEQSATPTRESESATEETSEEAEDSAETTEPPEIISTNTPSPTETPLPLPTNTPTLTATPTISIETEFPGTLQHTVRSTDTLESIATLYGSTAEVIALANDLDVNEPLTVGVILSVPVRIPNAAPRNTSAPSPTPVSQEEQEEPEQDSASTPEIFYIVRPGDTLSTIAQQFNTTSAELARLNGITNVNRIEVGQRLIIVPASDE